MQLLKNTVHSNLKTLLLLFMMTAYIADLSAQTENEKVVQQADKMPEFKGGTDALMKYLSENIIYPAEAKKKGEEGKVYVHFIIDENGYVKNAQVKKGVTAQLNAEALRVVNGMPAWTPGEQDGKKVKVEYTLPIMFALK